jgi:hypothetical protein
MNYFKDRMRYIPLTVATIIFLFTSACATLPVYTDTPFRATKEELHMKIKTIALKPLDIPDGLGNSEKINAIFEPLIMLKLHNAGFSVVESINYTEIWKRSCEQVGGVVDPATGKSVDSRIQAAQLLCLEILKTVFHADALLTPKIEIVPAKFSDCKARWHGTSEQIDEVVLGIFCVSGNMFGTVSALSLVVRVEDTQKNLLYVNSGGIQVLQRLEGFLVKDIVAVNEANLFTNNERNQTAVSIALGPLVQ